MNAQQRPNDDEAARRRLVIIHSLRDLLSEPEQQQAIELWDESFSQSRAFAIVSFVTKLDDRLGLGPRTAAIQRNLTQRMFMRQEELNASATRGASARSWSEPSSAPATAPEMLQTAAPQASSPAAVVFSALLQGTLRRVDRRLEGGTSTLARSLKRSLGGVALSPGARGVFTAWCDTSLVDSRLDLLEASDMKSVIHAIYLFVCDAFGPLIADRLFSEAVREAEDLPESSRFSPRKLF